MTNIEEERVIKKLRHKEKELKRMGNYQAAKKLRRARKKMLKEQK